MSEKDYQPLRVSQVIDETHDSRSFVFDIPNEKQDLFAYDAGQFLTFRVAYEGKLLTRSYSLASSPRSTKSPSSVLKAAESQTGSMTESPLAMYSRSCPHRAGLRSKTERVPW